MSSSELSEDFEDTEASAEEFTDEEEDARGSRNLYSEGLGFAHVRRLEQENELSRANLAEKELKLIGNYDTYLLISTTTTTVKKGVASPDRGKGMKRPLHNQMKMSNVFYLLTALSLFYGQHEA